MLAINKDGPVLRVELNRPESLNSLDDDVLLEVTDLYTRLQQRFDLKAVVATTHRSATAPARPSPTAKW